MRIIQIFLNSSFAQTSEESDSESDEDVNLIIFSKYWFTYVRLPFLYAVFVLIRATVKLYGRNQRRQHGQWGECPKGDEIINLELIGIPVSKRSNIVFFFFFQNLIEVIPDNLVTEESTEVPLVDNPTNETATTESSESDETSETSESSESSEMGQVKTVDCVNSTESCESDEYFFQGFGDDGLYTVDNLMAPDERKREFQLRRWWASMNWIYSWYLDI